MSQTLWPWVWTHFRLPKKLQYSIFTDTDPYAVCPSYRDALYKKELDKFHIFNDKLLYNYICLSVSNRVEGKVDLSINYAEKGFVIFLFMISLSFFMINEHLLYNSLCSFVYPKFYYLFSSFPFFSTFCFPYIWFIVSNSLVIVGRTRPC